MSAPFDEWEEPRRLGDGVAGDDVAALFRSTEPLPRANTASRALVKRRVLETVRAAHGRGALGWNVAVGRWLWRPVLVVGSIFLSGGIVGAALLHRFAPPVEAPRVDTAASPVQRAKPRGARPRVASAPVVQVAAPVEATVVPAAPVEPAAPPVATRRTPKRRMAAAASRSVDAPSLMPPAEAVAAAPAPRLTPEHELLGEAMRRLYRDRDPSGALAAVTALERRAPGAFVPEIAAVRVDALVALGRKGEALAVLERGGIDSLPRADERRALRGELRAGAGRCAEARDDFERVLGRDRRNAAFERALYGRALCAARDGNTAGARADLRLYLQLFPSGRFAHAAARALDGGGTLQE